MVHPGTIIRIDGLMTHVNDEYREIMFLRKGDKILTKRYRSEEE